MVSRYIQDIRDWKIREMVTGFLESKFMFEKSIAAEKDISFSILKKLCDMLFEIKENHHLIFRKIVDPKKRTFEIAQKFTPNEEQINFMNTVGLLFHKVMVARELKYVMDYYQEDSTDYQETKASLSRNLDRIRVLFDEGIHVLLSMLKSHIDNIHLISYFLENANFCSELFNMDLESLIKIISKKDGLESAYLLAAQFYSENGWLEKAEVMCKKALAVNPQNTVARSLLASLSKN
ncbi:MAG: hypothetical protein V2J62_01975 [candidate division KSB1 bacterium]|jgi:tetratricopeptide (TPR) repeat protein|nr:hypothetical protein [candidate division KSB1 bacterium]